MYRPEKRLPDNTCAGKSPSGGDASGGMVAHDLVNEWQATAWRDERSEPPEAHPRRGLSKVDTNVTMITSGANCRDAATVYFVTDW